jgi:hypothetical protein
VLGADELPGTALLDLGGQSLEGFDPGEHLFQLLIDGLPAELRPPRADPSPEALRPEQEALKAVAAAVMPARSSNDAALSARGQVTRARQARPTLTRALMLRRERTYSLGSRVFDLEGVAPDPELVALLHDLGFVLMTARERLRMVANYLSDHDPALVARELKKRRATAAPAETAVQIDALAREVDALVGLAGRQAALQDKVRRFGPRIDELREALFEIRLGRGSRDDLLGQVRDEQLEIDVLLNGLRAQFTTALRSETFTSAELRSRWFGTRVRRRFGRHRRFVSGGRS